jgi:preprotein translocase subunit SecD
VARFPNAQDAHLARAHLGSHGIGAVVQHDHAPYVTAAPWVLVQVAQRDRDLAITVLDRGPVWTARAVDIGEQWNVPAVEPQERSIRLARGLAVVAVVVLALVGLWILFRIPRVQAVFIGTTKVVLEADADSAVLQALRAGRIRLAWHLESRDVQYGTIRISEPDALELTSIDPRRVGEVQAELEQLFLGWTTSQPSTDGLRVAVSAHERERIVAAALDAVLVELRRELGATRVEVGERDGERITIHASLAGTWSWERVRETFPRPVTIEFREVICPPAVDPGLWVPPGSPDELLALFGGRLPPGAEVVEQVVDDPTNVLRWPLRSVPLVGSADFAGANPVTDEFGDPGLALRLSDDAGDRLESATRRLVGHTMAIVMHDEKEARVISTPVIQSVIGRECVINGLHAEAANSIALQLKAGARPLWLTPASKPVGPE